MSSEGRVMLFRVVYYPLLRNRVRRLPQSKVTK
jgi:hypothetical protein